MTISMVMRVFRLLCLIMPVSCLARIGCMDNSWHLAQKYDHKEYHYVQCTCPCEKQYQISADGTCTKCYHRREETLILHEPMLAEQKIINVARLQKYAAKKLAKKRQEQKPV